MDIYKTFWLVDTATNEVLLNSVNRKILETKGKALADLLDRPIRFCFGPSDNMEWLAVFHPNDEPEYHEDIEDITWSVS